METVTVDEAIKRGRRLLYWHPSIIRVICLTPPTFALYHKHTYTGWLLVVCICCFVFGIVLSYGYYFLNLARWRIWAFTNVQDVHELGRQAFLHQLLPEEGSFLWRFEVKNAEQRRLLAELERKLAISALNNQDSRKIIIISRLNREETKLEEPIFTKAEDIKPMYEMLESGDHPANPYDLYHDFECIKLVFVNSTLSLVNRNREQPFFVIMSFFNVEIDFIDSDFSIMKMRLELVYRGTYSSGNDLRNGKSIFHVLFAGGQRIGFWTDGFSVTKMDSLPPELVDVDQFA